MMAERTSMRRASHSKVRFESCRVDKRALWMGEKGALPPAIIHAICSTCLTVAEKIPSSARSATQDGQPTAAGCLEKACCSAPPTALTKPRALFSTHACESLAIWASRLFSLDVFGTILSCASSERPFLAMFSFVALCVSKQHVWARVGRSAVMSLHGGTCAWRGRLV